MELKQNPVIAIIGLGYVGLPLAVEFAKQYSTIGFDIDPDRISALQQGNDVTLEVDSQELAVVDKLSFVSEASKIANADIYIITVPTPIDEYKRPDLSHLQQASAMLGTVLSRNNIVIYESTVYPGATEEECIPILSSHSGLKFNQDFYAGYSPERINPGDKTHRITSIKKVTSGSTPEIADYIDSLYLSIISAGTHKTSSIKVAEAAKVIENTQRDLNIALINELAIIFNKLDINTTEVLEAAGSKWNFLPFKPGLVGGHCIGVDPYYLTHKAQQFGYHPEIILAGRRMNDSMGHYIVSQLVKKMIQKNIQVAKSNILIMGLAFKENCPDIRNTRIIDIINELQEYGANVDIFDPLVDANTAARTYAIKLIDQPEQNHYHAVLLAVAHDEFKHLGADKIRSLGNDTAILFDVKNILPKDTVDGWL
ncbi:MAG: Vi polysaccharide biosynthesis UDP-N-acetylglucosamine C-6 dehydrogenase TviB [Pseudomonadales bacterium]|nr:Vi polysaccharide biosynthesis UDP-N-acetylglucosamine C-6 dehydrogenase TviB [Pseudomonadales bacterium]